MHKMPEQTPTPTIRRATAADAGGIWPIFQAVAAAGDTYAFDPDISREQALAYWMGADKRCYVAEADGRVLGTFIVKDNQPGLGSHVANASFMVAAEARGLGLGRLMGIHALDEARRLGYRAMQFNLVVSTNEPAVALWRKLGFDVVGTLPEAFAHRQKRAFVDAYVMYRKL